ncbi:MAG: carbohydrate kinase family protein [Halanaerobiales bacterium]|nr:carbohydrate kinase family protein [Halanaerobiales bacterium]
MKNTISVIGAVFVDIKGMSFGAVNKDARNLGKVIRSHGGSTRNVAEDLNMMGMDCTYISTVNDDQLGGEVIQRLKNVGINTEYLKPCPEGMGLWLAVIDNEGNLISSISQLPDLHQLESLVMEKIKEVVQKSRGIGLDLDLTLPIANKVIETCKKHSVPLYGMVGNLDIISHYPDVLKGLDCFVCNKEEAELFLHQKINDLNDAKEAVMRMALLGSQSVIITLDKQGCVYFDSKTKEHGHYPTPPVTVVDSTGAGDGFFAGVVYELVQGNNIRKAVATGTQIATRVIQIKENNLVEKIEIEELVDHLA